MKTTLKIIIVVIIIMLSILLLLPISIFTYVLITSEKDPRTINELYKIYTNNESEFNEVGNLLEKYNIEKIGDNDFNEENKIIKDGVYVYTKDKIKISEEDLNTIVDFYNKHEFDKVYRGSPASDGDYYVFILLSQSRKASALYYFPTLSKDSKYNKDYYKYNRETDDKKAECDMHKKINDNWNFSYYEILDKKDNQNSCVLS